MFIGVGWAFVAILIFVVISSLISLGKNITVYEFFAVLVHTALIVWIFSAIVKLSG